MIIIEQCDGDYVLFYNGTVVETIKSDGLADAHTYEVAQYMKEFGEHLLEVHQQKESV